MKQIVKRIVQALNMVDVQEKGKLFKKLESLVQEENKTVVASLPISIVAKESRVKDLTVKREIHESTLYNQDGEAYDQYTLERLAPFVRSFSSLFQCIDMAVLSDKYMQKIKFTSKRPNDYWKRMHNCDLLDAMIKVEYLESIACQISQIEKELKESDNGQWSLESRLRDDMRSKKENPLLRQKPYIVVYIALEGEVSSSVNGMIEHYFEDNVIHHKSYLIAYAPTLHEVSLRTFYKKY